MNFTVELKDLRKKGLYRRLEAVDSPNEPALRLGRKKFLNFSSNNYLGLAFHPEVIRKSVQALRRWGTGSGASRLLAGNLRIHEELEKRLAAFKGEEAAIVFSSGYLANLGAVTALVNERDLVLADRLNHASLFDAAKLSRAKLWVYPHRNVAELNRLLERAKTFRRRLVLTEAYFGMDGDVAPLDRMAEICRRRKAMLMIDEAHSTGVFGKNGRGLTEHFGLSGKIDVVMGTLSKALGSVGGYLAGKCDLKEFLVNRCRSFLYTTAPHPGASAAALAGLGIIEKEPGLRGKLWENIRFVREGLREIGLDSMGSEGPIVPILIGDAGKTLACKKFLWERGIFAGAIRPPTVPRKTDRIRLSILSGHSKQNLEALVEALKKMKGKFL